MTEPSAGAKDLDAAGRLWQVSEELTQTRFPLTYRPAVPGQATGGATA
ncbi:hypothetical protein ACFYON_27760 [Micromonospora sp. NPDC005686]